MSLFIPITKVDAAKRLVYGTVTEEVPDKAGEILDYATARPAFEKWSRRFQETSGGKSLGNVRAMHGRVAAGKFTDISFDDEHRRISGVAKIIDDDEWQKVLEGVYTGFSIGGGYARRWPDAENPALIRYTPILSEVSLVDNPAVPTATFEVIKQDGSVECRKFNMLRKDNAVADNDMEHDEEHISALLAELAWLEEDVKDEEEASEILPHILALQQYLSDEEEEMASQLTRFSSLRGGGADEAIQKTRGIAETGLLRSARNDGWLKAPEIKTLHNTIEALQKRVAALESQPLPPKGILRAVSKSGDRGSAEDNSLAKLTPDQRVHELMKAALANPIAF